MKKKKKSLYQLPTGESTMTLKINLPKKLIILSIFAWQFTFPWKLFCSHNWENVLPKSRWVCAVIPCGKFSILIMVHMKGNIWILFLGKGIKN